MSTDIARAFFIGRITRDMEEFFSGTGNLFGVVTVAVNVYQGRNLPEKTSFFRITVPGRTVDGIGPFLKKGRQIAVEAVPVLASWTDSNGNRKTRVQFDATNIQLLGAPRRAGVKPDGDHEHAKHSTGEVHAVPHEERSRDTVQGAVPYEETTTTPEELFQDDMPF